MSRGLTRLHANESKFVTLIDACDPSTMAYLLCRSLYVVAVGAGLLPTASAQFVQQGGKLVGTGAIGNAMQGHAVSVSADGNTAIVGGTYDNGGFYGVWV